MVFPGLLWPDWAETQRDNSIIRKVLHPPRMRIDLQLLNYEQMMLVFLTALTQNPRIQALQYMLQTIAR